MNENVFLLIPGDDGWLIVGCGEASDDIDCETQSHAEDNPGGNTEVATAGVTSGGGGEGLSTGLLKCHIGRGRTAAVIALPAHWCYAASISTEGLPARQLRQALPYRFEPQVPFPIEDLAVDIHGHGDTRLLVATKAEMLQSAVHELEDAGVRVCTITPLSLLTVQGAIPHDVDTPLSLSIAETTSRSGDIVDSRNEITITRNEVTEWRWQPTPPKQNDDSGETGGEFIDADNALKHACAAACAIACETAQPLINLQQGALASRQKLEQIRKPLSACLAAAALLMLAAIIGMQARAWQYRQLAQTHDDASRSAYVEAFPGETVPVSMDRRLKTRLRDLRGRQGLAPPAPGSSPGSDNSIDASTDSSMHYSGGSGGGGTLAVVYELIDRLPEEMRFIVIDVRVNRDRIDLTGHARSHSDADAIASALRRDDRFTVTPPSTENLQDQGVQFTLNLTPRKDPRPPESNPGSTGTLAVEPAGSTSGGNTTQQPRQGLDGGTP